MSKFKVGQLGTLSNSRTNYPARIISEFGLKQLIVAYDAYGRESVILIDKIDGSTDGGWSFIPEVKEEKHISYLFADGTATAFRPVDAKVDITRPYVAVVTAIKTDKGFTKHELRRVDQTEEEMAETVVEDTTSPNEKDEDILDVLFGKDWRSKVKFATQDDLYRWGFKL